ncbi:hypothetical protein WSK_2231, partial [Novosphingobium sp. Rr 2-17]
WPSLVRSNVVTERTTETQRRRLLLGGSLAASVRAQRIAHHGVIGR